MSLTKTDRFVGFGFFVFIFSGAFFLMIYDGLKDKIKRNRAC